MDVNCTVTSEDIAEDEICYTPVDCICDIMQDLDELDKLRKFKEYFDELYGIGLEVKNWHLNGATEPFDSLYESAIEESGR